MNVGRLTAWHDRNTLSARGLPTTSIPMAYRPVETLNFHLLCQLKGLLTGIYGAPIQELNFNW